MKLLLILFALVLIAAGTYKAGNSNNSSGSEKMNNLGDIVVKDMSGKDVPLSDYKGKVLLIVNVASQCGYTPQYKGLQKLYEKYKDQGLEILGFPCNDFGGQEPGTNEEIKNFCSVNFHVSFPLFDKVKILGQDKSPLYKRLTNNSVTEKSDIKWNFEKFLISRDGTVVSRFNSKVPPEDEKLIDNLEKELAKK